MGQAVKQGACPKCGSSDAYTTFADGSTYCFSAGCGHGERGDSGDGITFAQIHNLPWRPLKARGLSEEVAKEYGVKVYQVDGKDRAYFYPLYEDGEAGSQRLSGYQVRKLPKKFSRIGKVGKAKLFGHQVNSGGSTFLVLCEGADDTMAARAMLQSQGKDYRVRGSLGDKGWKANLEYLEQFATVAICYDQDGPGQTAANKIADALTPGKAKIVNWEGAKDPNDLWNQGRSKDFLKAINNGKVKRPDGVVSGSSTWDRLKNRVRAKSLPYPEHWSTMNAKTKGIRLGELDTWTSGSGMGKTQVLRELQYHILNKTTDNIGIIALEEPLEDTVEAMMSIHVNQRIHLMENDPREEPWYREAWEFCWGQDRIHLYDHFGSLDETTLLAKIRFMARGLGVKYVFLDHLSIVVSEFADQGGERELIDTLMTKLKNLTQELNIWIGLVVHLRKTGTGSKSFETGEMPTLDDLRGSGSIKQLSNSVYALARNQQEADPIRRNTSQLGVLKCRFTGDTGDADKLYFDGRTGRMVEPPEPEQPEFDNEEPDFDPGA